MKVKIQRVWNNELDNYKEALDKYNAVYTNYASDYYATIEINSLEELMSLPKELEEDIIISHIEGNRLDIYDDYIE